MAYHRGQWAIQEAAEEKKREVVRRREEELGKFRELVAAAERWKRAELVREYVVAVAAGGGVDPGWIEWASKKADWVDPVVQGEDEVLGRYGEAGK